MFENDPLKEENSRLLIVIKCYGLSVDHIDNLTQQKLPEKFLQKKLAHTITMNTSFQL